MRHCTFAVRRGFQALGQGVGHAHAHAVQAAGKTVGAAFALIKLATGVQAGEHQFDDRRFFFGVHAKGNAASVIVNRHRAVGVQNDFDFFAMPGQGFVGGVVQHFLYDMQRVVGAGVHTRTLFDGLQAFEDADRAFGIGIGGGLSRRYRDGGFGGHGDRL